MIAHPPARDGDDVTIRFDGKTHATFRFPPEVRTAGTADAAVAAGWLPAMAAGEPLVVDGPVSARLVDNAELIADILVTWDRALHPGHSKYSRVPLVATRREEPADEPPRTPNRRGTACFFTGGIDSFHSVLRRRDELDALIFVHGFDLLDDQHDPLNQQVSARLQAAAGMLGLPLIEVECNLVAYSTSFGISWDDYHGSALATVALLLAPHFSKVFVPATTTYAVLYPLGSHPLLDPLWSTEQVQIVHDGADATRFEKVRAIAGEPAARHHLRVCFENRDGLYNCGQCEKCIRSGVAIRVAGVEGSFPSLPPPTLRQIASVNVVGLGTAWKGYRDELARTKASERLRRAIDIALARRRMKQWPHVGRWVP
mgnify:CR=1 FL=1